VRRYGASTDLDSLLDVLDKGDRIAYVSLSFSEWREAKSSRDSDRGAPKNSLLLKMETRIAKPATASNIDTGVPRDHHAKREFSL
jgi:hypothetical protein